jgi:hypothetical protein
MHVLYHFCDMHEFELIFIFELLVQFSAVLKFHVVCTCNFFGDTICHLTNPKMIKIVTLIELLIYIQYCIEMGLLTLLFSHQYLSES